MRANILTIDLHFGDMIVGLLVLSSKRRAIEVAPFRLRFFFEVNQWNFEDSYDVILPKIIFVSHLDENIS